MKTLDLALLISGVCCFWNQKIFTNQMDWNEGISINQVADEATALYSGAKRPFNFTDLVDMDRMSDMTISPSGDKSVYVQWHYYKTTDKISRNLVMLSHSKNEPKSTVLTIPKQGVSASEPVWINNENVIFFQKDKEVANGVPQLMKINVNSLKIEPVFSNALSVEIANLKYKNGLLFFTASVKPSTEFFDESFKTTKSADFTSALVFDNLYVRHWDTFDNHKNSHLFTLKYDGSSAVKPDKALNLMRNLNLSTPVLPFGDASNFVISPDGSEILFASMNDFNQAKQAWSTNVNIYSLRIDDDLNTKPVCLTGYNPGVNNAPTFSPNGQKIAYLEMRTPQFEADKNHLVILDRASSKRIDVNDETWDRSISSYIWSEDGKSIYAIVDEFETRHREVLISEGHVSSVFLIPNRPDLLAVMHDTVSRPSELFSFNLKSKEMIQISHLHTEYLKDVETSKPEEFWFTGALNQKVMGWILKPFGFNPSKKYPLAFLIHGGPQSSWGDSFSTRWNPSVFAGQGYVVVMINFHGSTGYGQNFVNSISKEWGSYPYEDLMKGLDYALAQNSFIDKNRIAALGASYGGYMINWLQGHTKRFKCMVNHDGLFDVKSMYYGTEELYFPEFEFGGTPFKNPELYNKWNPSNFIDNWSTPTLVIHGGRDYRVPEGEGFSTFTALQRKGVESRLVFFPDENHWVLRPANSLKWHSEVFAWINKFTSN